MSCRDLTARHYLLRTTNNIVHPTVDISSVRSTRFTDGKGMCWLSLQLSRYSLDAEQGTAGIGGDSESIVKGRDGKEDQDQDTDGDVEKGENVNEALVELLMQHCASPRRSINVELDIPNTSDGSEPGLEPFLHQIIPTKPDTTVDKVETMSLNPTHRPDEEGTASNKAGLGDSSGLEGWAIRDGRAWFSKAFLLYFGQFWNWRGPATTPVGGLCALWRHC